MAVPKHHLEKQLKRKTISLFSRSNSFIHKQSKSVNCIRIFIIIYIYIYINKYSNTINLTMLLQIIRQRRILRETRMETNDDNDKQNGQPMIDKLLEYKEQTNSITDTDIRSEANIFLAAVRIQLHL